MACYIIGQIILYEDNNYDCEDVRNDCAGFAPYCEHAPGWAAVICPHTCGKCHLREASVRCNATRIGYDNSNILVPGSLDKIFKEKLKRYPHEVISTEPWVVQLTDFLTDKEVDTLINWGHRAGLQRSTDQGEYDKNGVQNQVTSDIRTSDNAWCMNECEADPTIDNLIRKVETMLDIQRDHYENFQILRYLPGQYYKRHHDSSTRDNKSLHGPRILTVFFYLNDVEEGGETQFTDMKPPLAVKPKRGSVIIWPSVKNEDPTQIEPLTAHEAMPVIKGIKYGANLWIHLRNFRMSNHHGCGGNFS